MSYTTALPTVTLSGPTIDPFYFYLDPKPVQVNTFPQTLRASYAVDGVDIKFVVKSTGTVTYVSNKNWIAPDLYQGGALLDFTYVYDSFGDEYDLCDVIAGGWMQTSTASIPFVGQVVAATVTGISNKTTSISFPNLPFFSTGTNTTFTVYEYIGPQFFANFRQILGLVNPVTLSGSVIITYYYHHK